MLKCHIAKNRMTKLTVNGTAHELMLELLLLIHMVFKGILKRYPEDAIQFKLDLIGSLLDPRSPVWKEDAIK